MYVNITTISVTAFCLANQKGFEAFSICQSFYVFTTHSPYMGNRKIKSAKFEREAVFYRVRNVYDFLPVNNGLRSKTSLKKYKYRGL